MMNYPRIPIPAPARARSFVYSSTVDQKFAIGTKLALDDGRIFRYTQVGKTTTIYKALMVQSEVPIANWKEVPQTGKAMVVGSQTYNALILTGSGLAANDWDEGWMLVQDGAIGADAYGDMYKIAAHTVHDTAPIVTVADQGGLRTVTGTTTEITFIKSKFKHVIVTGAGVATAIVVGVPLVDVLAKYFCWLQTRGPCPLIVDVDDVAEGDPVGESTTGAVSGACGLIDESIATKFQWGTCMYAGTAGQADEPAIIDLCLE